MFKCVCVCVFARALLHPSASPATDIQMAPCEKLNREAVEVLALLFLSGRDSAPKCPFDMVMSAHCGGLQGQMHAGICSRCQSVCVVYLVAEGSLLTNRNKQVFFAP